MREGNNGVSPFTSPHNFPALYGRRLGNGRKSQNLPDWYKKRQLLWRFLRSGTIWQIVLQQAAPAGVLDQFVAAGQTQLLHQIGAVSVDSTGADD